MNIALHAVGMGIGVHTKGFMAGQHRLRQALPQLVDRSCSFVCSKFGQAPLTAFLVASGKMRMPEAEAVFRLDRLPSIRPDGFTDQSQDVAPKFVWYQVIDNIDIAQIRYAPKPFPLL
ncbi:hypothetical protein B9Y75_12065 [Stenotrophomonas maltophilia]|nr:hypothetical protein B9Y75_12065 [Stenotrophomonas maltophilia]